MIFSSGHCAECHAFAQAGTCRLRHRGQSGCRGSVAVDSVLLPRRELRSKQLTPSNSKSELQVLKIFDRTKDIAKTKRNSQRLKKKVKVLQEALRPRNPSIYGPPSAG